MVKIVTTKEIESILYNHLWKKGRYIIFEVAVPRSIQNRYHRDRLDMCIYDTDGVFRGIEIKRNLQDFHSSASWSWICNYNYFGMPYSLYYQVKDEIPDGIGVWAIYDDGKLVECVKKPKYRSLLCTKEDMLCMMLQGLSREYKKYRKLREKEEKSSKKKSSKRSKRKNG